MTKPLGKILVECGFITNMQLSEALIKQKASGGSKRMGEIFMEMGIITHEHLETALKKQQEPATRSNQRKVPMTSGSMPAHVAGRQPAHQARQPVTQHRQQPNTDNRYPASPSPQPAPAGSGSKELMALVQLLIKKGVITMEEYFREMQR